MIWRVIILAGIMLLSFMAGGQYESMYDANTMRLLQSYRDAHSELTEKLDQREKAIAILKGKIRVASIIVEKTNQSLVALKQSMPTGEQIMAEVERASSTDKGLERETRRILGDLGITRIIVRP